eukprot:GEMP01079197.1.p1 GENE.GEMP01079197.1~~GEMP01079197.1.p1  ORF type:complete len:128 (+),score=24.06 GEMP01079197.1:42-425(+)
MDDNASPKSQEVPEDGEEGRRKDDKVFVHRIDSNTGSSGNDGSILTLQIGSDQPIGGDVGEESGSMSELSSLPDSDPPSINRTLLLLKDQLKMHRFQIPEQESGTPRSGGFMDGLFGFLCCRCQMRS